MRRAERACGYAGELRPGHDRHPDGDAGGEEGGGKIKFSLRAKEPDTINDVAQAFGGGGHPQASGITMDGPLEAAMDSVCWTP